MFASKTRFHFFLFNLSPFFLFLVSLLWRGSPVSCWIEAAEVDIQPYLRFRKILSLPPTSLMLVVGYLQMPLIRRKEFLSIPSLLNCLLWMCVEFCQMLSLPGHMGFPFSSNMKNYPDWHFVKDFCIQVHERYGSRVLFSCNTCLVLCPIVRCVCLCLTIISGVKIIISMIQYSGLAKPWKQKQGPVF